MRFYLGHRLPGGFFGGLGVGRYGRGRGRTRVVRGRPTRQVVVHMSGQQLVDLENAKRANRAGCLKLLAVGVVVGTVISYWYIVLPVAAVGAAILVYARRRYARSHPTTGDL